MKSGSITKNPKKLYLFHHDYINDNDKWHDLKKKLKDWLPKTTFNNLWRKSCNLNKQGTILMMHYLRLDNLYGLCLNLLNFSIKQCFSRSSWSFIFKKITNPLTYFHDHTSPIVSGTSPSKCVLKCIYKSDYFPLHLSHFTIFWLNFLVK